jgi:hypothetical protein
MKIDDIDFGKAAEIFDEEKMLTTDLLSQEHTDHTDNSGSHTDHSDNPSGDHNDHTDNTPAVEIVS